MHLQEARKICEDVEALDHIDRVVEYLSKRTHKNVFFHDYPYNSSIDLTEDEYQLIKEVLEGKSCDIRLKIFNK